MTRIDSIEDLSTTFEVSIDSRIYSVDQVMVFTRLLDGAYILKCIGCGWLYRGFKNDYCGNCGRYANWEEATETEYKAARQMIR